jgi:hypothetical protein
MAESKALDDLSRDNAVASRGFVARTLDVVMMGVGKALRSYTDKRIAELRKEIEAKLEGLPHDAGIYARGKSYRKGAIVTYGGSAFIAQCDTDAPIGGDPPSPSWRLMVQRGRNARD